MKATIRDLRRAEAITKRPKHQRIEPHQKVSMWHGFCPWPDFRNAWARRTAGRWTRR